MVKVIVNRMVLVDDAAGIPACTSYDDCVIHVGTSADEAVADLITRYSDGAGSTDVKSAYESTQYRHVYAIEELYTSSPSSPTLTCYGAGTFTSSVSGYEWALFGYFSSPGTYNCDLSVAGQTLRFRAVVGQSGNNYIVINDSTTGTSATLIISSVLVNGNYVLDLGRVRSSQVTLNTSDVTFSVWTSSFYPAIYAYYNSYHAFGRTDSYDVDHWFAVPYLKTVTVRCVNRQDQSIQYSAQQSINSDLYMANGPHTLSMIIPQNGDYDCYVDLRYGYVRYRLVKDPNGFPTFERQGPFGDYSYTYKIPAVITVQATYGLYAQFTEYEVPPGSGDRKPVPGSSTQAVTYVVGSGGMRTYFKVGVSNVPSGAQLTVSYTVSLRDSCGNFQFTKTGTVQLTQDTPEKTLYVDIPDSAFATCTQCRSTGHCPDYVVILDASLDNEKTGDSFYVEVYDVSTITNNIYVSYVEACSKNTNRCGTATSNGATIDIGTADAAEFRVGVRNDSIVTIDASGKVTCGNVQALFDGKRTIYPGEEVPLIDRNGNIYVTAQLPICNQPQCTLNCTAAANITFTLNNQTLNTTKTMNFTLKYIKTTPQLTLHVTKLEPYK